MEEPLLGMGAAFFRREAGDERRQILLIEGRYSRGVGLPLDDDWLEEFRLEVWRDGEPVYGPCGFTPRQPRTGAAG